MSSLANTREDTNITPKLKAAQHENVSIEILTSCPSLSPKDASLPGNRCKITPQGAKVYKYQIILSLLNQRFLQMLRGGTNAVVEVGCMDKSTGIAIRTLLLEHV